MSSAIAKGLAKLAAEREKAERRARETGEEAPWAIRYEPKLAKKPEPTKKPGSEPTLAGLSPDVIFYDDVAASGLDEKMMDAAKDKLDVETVAIGGRLPGRVTAARDAFRKAKPIDDTAEDDDDMASRKFDKRKKVTPDWKSGDDKGGSKRATKEALEKIAHRFNDRIGSMSSQIHSLASGGSLVVKKRTGDYRRHPMIGGEEFRLNSIYAGKSGKMIFVLKPAFVTAEYRFMELSDDQIATYLPSLAKVLDAFFDMPFLEYFHSYSEVYVEKEREQEELKHQESYGGSWGVFG